MTESARRFVGTALVALVALVGVACSSDSDEAASTTTAVTDDTAGVKPPEEYNLVEVAVSNGSFTVLAELLQAANLVGPLVGDGPFTVFGPNDEAFAAAAAELGLTPEELKTRLMSEANLPLLSQILSYHVVEGRLSAADLAAANGTELVTLAGVPLRVQVDGETVSLVDGAGRTVAVTQADVNATNGVIHVVGNVLLPTVPALS